MNTVQWTVFTNRCHRDSLATSNLLNLLSRFTLNINSNKLVKCFDFSKPIVVQTNLWTSYIIQASSEDAAPTIIPFQWRPFDSLSLDCYQRTPVSITDKNSPQSACLNNAWHSSINTSAAPVDDALILPICCLESKPKQRKQSNIGQLASPFLLMEFSPFLTPWLGALVGYSFKITFKGKSLFADAREKCGNLATYEVRDNKLE